MRASELAPDVANSGGPTQQSEGALRRALNEAAASEYTDIARPTLRQGRMGIAKCPTPPYVRLGRKIVYLKDDLDRFLEAHRQTA
jgi:hypothetical protein